VVTAQQGIFLSPFLEGGHQVAVAITSAGECVCKVVLVPGIDWPLAYDVLTLVLEYAEPKTRLTAIEGGGKRAARKGPRPSLTLLPPTSSVS
jgi:hypothetical protein